MTTRNFGVVTPPIVFPCGEEMGLPLPLLASLRGAGVEMLDIEKCYKCGESHQVPMPDCSSIKVTFTTNSGLQIVESHPSNLNGGSNGQR